MEQLLYFALVVFIAVICYTLYKSAQIQRVENKDHEDLAAANRKIGDLEHRIFEYTKALDVSLDQHKNLQQKFEQLQHQKISADVKMGQKTEQIAGLMENFPAPLHTLKFLGAPIDFVSIDLEKELITFIEVKTGQSQLSNTQKKIRKIIKEKKVEFREFRIEEKCTKVKK